MKPMTAGSTQHPDYRPWYREPWVWLLIALPAISIVGCAITIWLAITRPDYRVVDDQQLQQVESGLRAQQAVPNPSAQSREAATAAGRDDGAG